MPSFNEDRCTDYRYYSARSWFVPVRQKANQNDLRSQCLVSKRSLFVILISWPHLNFKIFNRNTVELQFELSVTIYKIVKCHKNVLSAS